jgi:anti-sigma-K factor RskA
MDTEHDALRDAYGLYVLGALEPAEHARLVAHLRTCDECASTVKSLREVAGALAFGVPQVAPSPALRSRVLSAAARVRTPRIGVQATALRPPPVTATSRRSRALVAGWLAAAAAAVVAVAFWSQATSLQTRLADADTRLADLSRRLDSSERRLQESTNETSAVRQRLAVLTAADAIELRLVGQPPARQSSARAFVSRTRGVLFAASNLPALPAGRTYQIWYLTRGAPISAGLVQPDAQGNATESFGVPADLAAPAGMAVSLEPDGGVPAPTGAIYLATQ